MAIDGKTIAQHEARAFGGKPKVFQYWNDEETHAVNLLSCVDGPESGVTSYGTVDLSQYDNQLSTPDGKPIRVEILGACASGVEAFANVMSTCALNVATGEYSLSPGNIHPRVVELYEPEATMKHVLFVPPFLWGDDAFPSMEDDDMAVAFLQAVPISDAEFELARSEGVDALEDRLAEEQVDILDLNRASVV